MPNDLSKKSSMIDKSGGTEEADGSGSASEQAQAMRARLQLQRENEKLLAEASELKGAAADEADAIVAAAERLATQLITEARNTAEALTTEARTAAEALTAEAKERAEEIVSRSLLEADELQRHTEEARARIREEVLAAGRAEIDEFRTRTAGLLDDAEGGLRRLAPRLEDAVSTLVEVRRSLDQVRQVDPGESPADRSGPLVLASVEAEPADEVSEPQDAAPTTADTYDDSDARPLGWLFRASQP